MTCSQHSEVKDHTKLEVHDDTDALKHPRIEPDMLEPDTPLTTGTCNFVLKSSLLNAVVVCMLFVLD